MSPPDNAPVFAEPWQAQVFALTLALHARGAFSWVEWTHVLAAELREHPDSSPAHYYEHWLCALERLLCTRGIADRAALSERKQAWEDAHRRTPHGTPVLPPAPSTILEAQTSEDLRDTLLDPRGSRL